jgi:hypothetical protein
VVPYLELITRNGLAERVEGGVPRYKTTAKGEEALRCMRELERLMPGRMRQLLKGWLNLAQIDGSSLFCVGKRLHHRGTEKHA